MLPWQLMRLHSRAVSFLALLLLEHMTGLLTLDLSERTPSAVPSGVRCLTWPAFLCGNRPAFNASQIWGGHVLSCPAGAFLHTAASALPAEL